MSVAYVDGASVVNTTAGTSVVVNRPTATGAGNLLIAYIGAAGNPTISTPAGWTLIGTQTAATNVTLAAFWAPSSIAGASWTWTLGSSQRNIGWVGAYSGVDLSNPIFSSVGTTTVTAGTTFASNTTSSMVGAAGVSFVAAVSAATGSAITWTVSGLAKRADLSTNGVTGIDIAGALTETAPRGSTIYSPSWTASQSCTQGAMWAVVLRPTFVGYNPTVPFAPIVELAFGADPDGDPSVWNWVDVSARLRDADGINMAAGRMDATSQSSPTRVDLVFNNPAGDLTPDNPNSPFYPKVLLTTPLRLSVPYGFAAPTELSTTFVTSWIPQWAASPEHCVVRVQALGRMDRLQSTNRPVNSVLTRALRGPSPRTQKLPLAYWPGEDNSGSTSLAPVTSRTPPLGISGAVAFAADSSLLGSAPLPTLPDGGSIGGAVPPYTATGFWCATMVAKIPSAVAAVNHILTVTTNGSARYWTITLVPGAPDTLNIRAYDQGGTQILTDGFPLNVAAFYGQWKLFQLDVRQNGANITYEVYAWDSTLAVVGTTGTLVSQTHGNAQAIYAAANSVTAGTAIGHFAVFVDPGFTPFSDLSTLVFRGLTGQSGEYPQWRFTRLCVEAGVVNAPTSNAGAIAMGPQPIGQFMNVLRECEAVDQGLIHDNGHPDPILAVSGGALTFVQRSDRYAVDPTMILDNAQGHLSVGFEPIYDVTGLKTDVTVGRNRGSSARYVGDTSQGAYPDQQIYNLSDDRHLYEMAGWRANSASTKRMRYPKLGFDLRRNPELIRGWLATPIGSRIQAINLPRQHGPGGAIADVFVEGYTQFINGDRWTVTAVCSPAEPYNVAVVEGPGDTAWRVDTDGASLTADITATALSWTVTIPAGNALFTTAGADFPVDVDIDGERITLSGITGVASPQTFTASARSVNGVVKIHKAGAAVKGWRIRPVAL